MCKHMWVWCRYTRRRLERTHGAEGEGGHRQFCLPKFAHAGLSRAPEVQQRNPSMVPIFSLRIGREQHVAESSIYSLHLNTLFNSKHVTQRHTHIQQQQQHTTAQHSATQHSTAQHSTEHATQKQAKRREEEIKRRRETEMKRDTCDRRGKERRERFKEKQEKKREGSHVHQNFTDSKPQDLTHSKGFRAALGSSNHSRYMKHVTRNRAQDHGIYTQIYMCTHTYTRTFHDVYSLKPLTFHNGFMFFASRGCFKHFCRFQALTAQTDREETMCVVHDQEGQRKAAGQYL